MAVALNAINYHCIIYIIADNVDTSHLVAGSTSFSWFSLLFRRHFRLHAFLLGRRAISTLLWRHQDGQRVEQERRTAEGQRHRYNYVHVRFDGSAERCPAVTQEHTRHPESILRCSRDQARWYFTRFLAAGACFRASGRERVSFNRCIHRLQHTAHVDRFQQQDPERIEGWRFRPASNLLNRRTGERSYEFLAIPLTFCANSTKKTITLNKTIL